MQALAAECRQARSLQELEHALVRSGRAAEVLVQGPPHVAGPLRTRHTLLFELFTHERRWQDEEVLSWVQCLERHGVPVDATDSLDQNVLFVAATGDYPQTCKYERRGEESLFFISSPSFLFRYLLRRLAALNVTVSKVDMWNQTAAFTAARYGQCTSKWAAGRRVCGDERGSRSEVRVQGWRQAPRASPS